MRVLIPGQTSSVPCVFTSQLGDTLIMLMQLYTSCLVTVLFILSH